jgi:uncharacterized lipoprotein YmbA
MSAIGKLAFALATTLGVAACGISPEPVYYAMTPVRGHPDPGWARTVQLRRPALAGYLDRGEIVSRVVDTRLLVSKGESWSEPLGDMIGRLLGEDLATRLPGSIVYTEASPISATPDAIVAIDVPRFDVGEDGQLVLVAEVTVERLPDRTAVASRRLELRDAPRSFGTAGLVRSMSVLLGRLADDVAVDLRAQAPSAGSTGLGPGLAAPCMPAP